MGSFAVLRCDSEVQVGEKIRLDARDCFVNGGTTLSSITVKPDRVAAAQNVWNGTVGDKFLDWAFTFQFIVAAGDNDKIDFKENGVEKHATVAAGTYATVAALAAAIQTAMNLASTGYTVSVNSLRKLTIAKGSAFQLLLQGGVNYATSLLGELGLLQDGSLETSAVLGPVDYAVQKATVDLNSGTTVTKLVKVYSPEGDRLFSSDDDLLGREPAIFDMLADGYSTFNKFHRNAQRLMVAWLDKEGYVDTYGAKFTKHALGDLNEVRDWAACLALSLIYRGSQNAVDDVFGVKAAAYEKMAAVFRDRVVLTMDLDQDGAVDPLIDKIDVRSCRVVRR